MNDELAEISIKRRMPANLTRFLIKMQGGKVYLPAAYRLVWFRDECPDWGIVTELIEGGQADGYATMKATVFNTEGRIVATAHKTETKQDFPAGWVEKAEAGAVARALAYVGFGTQFSEDVDAPKQAERVNTPVASQNASPQATASQNGIPASNGKVPRGTINDSGAVCATCHAPVGKPHLGPCILVEVEA